MNRPNVAAGLLIGFFALQCSFPAAGQVPKEKELKTEIKEVTVFFKGAQVFESGSVAIPAGKTLLQVKGLSPYLDKKKPAGKGYRGLYHTWRKPPAQLSAKTKTGCKNRQLK